jgi:hypothetical protein
MSKAPGDRLRFSQSTPCVRLAHIDEESFPYGKHFAVFIR